MIVELDRRGGSVSLEEMRISQQFYQESTGWFAAKAWIINPPFQDNIFLNNRYRCRD